MQRNNLLNALEVIETLKDTVKKADAKVDKNSTQSIDLKKNTYVDSLVEDKSNENIYDSNNKSGNQMILNKNYYLNTTETINQTYDNQILFTDKTNFNENETSRNIFNMKKDIVENKNINKNKIFFQNIANESKFFFNFKRKVLKN